MNENIKVLLVEDEKEVREKYKKALKGHPKIELVGEVDNSEEALSILNEKPIDALLLDLELGSGDSGVFLLEKIQSMRIEKPFIAVVTNVVSRVVYQTIRKMGVDYICAKEDNYSFDVPLSIIEISAPYRTLNETPRDVAQELNGKTTYEVYHKNVEEKLSKLGFLEKLVGTPYTLDSIMYLLMSDQISVGITKEIYPAVASKYHTNTSNVERNIRIAIEKVWTTQSTEKLKKLYPYEWNAKTGRPTNSEFIYNIKQQIKRQ